MKKQRVPEIHINTKIKNKNSNPYLFIKPFIPIFMVITGAVIIGIIGNHIYKSAGYILAGIFVMLIYLINNSRKNKRVKDLYEQLDKFMKRCCNDGYNDLALYFGTTYTNYEGSLSKAMEKCYMTAVRTNDSKRALKEFKDTYKLAYFNFCIDTLQTIKSSGVQISTDYLYKQTKNKLTNIQSAYKEQSAAKTDIILASVNSIILFILMNHLLGMKTALFFTPIGIILSIILVLLFIFGMLLSMKG